MEARLLEGSVVWDKKLKLTGMSLIKNQKDAVFNL
jgi:hypothetical protein